MQKFVESIWWLGFLVIITIVCVWLIFGHLRADGEDWLLTEVMANARDEKRGEFLEIKYFGDERDLSGLSIADNQDEDNLIVWENEHLVQRANSRIFAGDLLIIFDPECADEYGEWWMDKEIDIGKVVVMTVDDLDIGNGLNNNGEEIKIFDKDKNVLANFNWGAALVDGKSLEYLGDDLCVNDSQNGHNLGWVRNLEGGEIYEDDKNTGDELEEEWLRFWQDGQMPIKINELMVNPVGDDESEWIELVNCFDREIDLDGWYICDSKCELNSREGGYKLNNVFVSPGEYLVINRSESGISLNNNGDKLFLYDPNHDWVDAMEYDLDAGEGVSWSWSGAQWLRTAISTPGADNIVNNDKDVTEIDYEKIDHDLGFAENFLGSLNEVKGIDDGEKVRVQGIALVDYGLINQDSLWIGDQSGGLMIKGDVLLKIKKGEKILVSGVVDSLKYQKIVRVDEVTNVDLNDLSLNKILISDMGDFQDRLVTVEGKIKQKTTLESFVLEDKSGEVRVLIKDGIEIDKNLVKIGNGLKISGIVVMTADGYKLYPTEKNDIVLVGGGMLPQVGPDWAYLVSLRW